MQDKQSWSKKVSEVRDYLAQNLFSIKLVVFTLILLYSSLCTQIPILILLPIWVVILFVITFYYASSLRLKYFTKPLYSYMKRALPPMSDTEQIALDAGDVDWEGDLFTGRPNWQQFTVQDEPKLSSEEQDFMSNQVEKLCEMLDDWHIVNELQDLPQGIWKYIKEEGFFGLNIPKEFGGHGFSALACSNIVTKIASRSISAAVTVMVPNSLGPAELLWHYGTKEQKKYYLPRLANGQEVPCFGLTGPEAGSDAGAMDDSGVVCYQTVKGKKTLGIKLNFEKRYITLAPVATLLGIAFKLYDPDQLLGDQKSLGITLCLIPSTTDGVTIGPRHCPLFMAFMNGTIRGSDVFVPMDAVIGGPEMAGQGWRMLMECLSIGRGISLPALATANAKVSYRMTSAYSSLRKQFKVPIHQFEGVADNLGNIAGYTYLIEATRIYTADIVSRGIKPALISAITKYHLTECGRKVTDMAMDVHAGRGIQLGPRNYLAFAHMGNPISITVEGANILTRNLMIFGQGALRCHPYLRKEINLINSTDPDALHQFDSMLGKHVAYTAKNGLRTFIFGLTGGYFIRTGVKSPIAKYCRKLTRISGALAFLADITMLLLGGKLKRKERISARLGDILSYLYLGSCSIKYFQNQNSDQELQDYLEWSIAMCLYQCQTAIIDLCRNYPSRFLGILLKWLVFPLGRSFRKPGDKLNHALAMHSITESQARNTLSAGIYLGKAHDDPTGRIENAWKKLHATQALNDKLTLAIKAGQVERKQDFADQLDAAVSAGILTTEDKRALAEFEALRLDALAVDEFPFAYLSRVHQAKKDG